MLTVALFVFWGIASYFNTFGVPFHFDDHTSILENTRIRSLWPLRGPLNPPQDTTAAGRPILSLSLAVNYALGGYNVAGYHAFNLAIHILAALALFGVVRRTLLTHRLRDRFQAHSFTLALAVSLLWMLHPLQTESVTYIIQRAESLVGLFFLITFYCAIRGFESSRPKYWFIAAVSSCALGMGSKEVMVSAPLLVWLYDRTFVSGSFSGALERSRALYLGLAASWFILAALLGANPRGQSAGFGFEHVPPYNYAITQAEVLLHYFRLALWPAGLCFYYRWPIADSLLDVLPSMSVLATILGAVLWTLVRSMPISFLGAWFFAILAPSSSIVPVVTEVAAEHRMYLPLAAIISAMVLGGYFLISKYPAFANRVLKLSPKYVLALGGLALLAFALQTYKRNMDYRDERTLWSDTIRKQPANSTAHANLAYALTRMGRVEEALTHFREAVRLRPDYVYGLQGVALCLLNLGRFEEAIDHLKRAFRIRPHDPNTWYSMSFALRSLGKLDAAVQVLAQASRLNPEMVNAQTDLAEAYEQLGKTGEAIERYREVVRIRPDRFEAHVKLGNALLGQGKFPEAADAFVQAARIKPEDPTTHASLAAAYYYLERYSDAWGEIQLCRRLGGQPPEQLLGVLSARMQEPR